MSIDHAKPRGGWFLAGLFLTSCCGAVAARAQDAAGAVAELKALVSQGRHAEVVAQADALLTSASHWSLSFNTLVVSDAYLGTQYGYFIARTRGPAAPMLPVAAKHVPDNPQGYAEFDHASCVDLRTGKALWTRPFIPSSRFGVDPRDDALWVWHEGDGWFERVEAATGETTRRGEVPKTYVRPNQLECLRDGDADIWTRTTRNTKDPTAASRYDLVTKELVPSVARPFALSPGGLRRVSYTSMEYYTTVACSPPAGGKAVWTFQVADNSDNPPTWLGRDVLFMAGGAYAAAILYRVDGETGTPRWRTPLGAYGYSPAMHQLRGGTYANGGWTPVGALGDEVWAIDASNRLRFFNAATGAPTRSIFIGHAAPIAPPSFIPKEGAAVFVTTDGMRRVPLDRAPVVAPALAAKARALLALGKKDQALAVASGGAFDTDAPEAWDALADALTAAGESGRATAARVRSLIASGAATSEALRRSHGLLWRMECGPTKAQPFVLGATALVAELDGTVHTIDPAGCAEVQREFVEGGVGSWALKGDRLVSRGTDGKEDVVRQFARPPVLEPGDPVRGGTDLAVRDPAVDRDWYIEGGGMGPPVKIDGRFVRTVPGGGVRELVDKKMVETAGRFPRLSHWSYALLGDKAVGYGSGGIYELDNSLRPARLAVDLGPERLGRKPSAELVVGDGAVMALIVRDPEGKTTLELRATPDGRLLRSTPVSVLPGMDRQSARLVRPGNGFLLSSGELLYVPTDPARPEWRFGLLADNPPRRDWTEIDAVGFSVPRVIGDRLLVAGYRGVYVFDLTAIVGK
jgi:hypothetical protein